MHVQVRLAKDETCSPPCQQTPEPDATPAHQRRSAAGTSIAIGTEINMVARLAQEHPDKHIECLDEEICPCSTMYMIHPAYLMDVLERLVNGEVPNQIVVPKSVQEGALLALNRMLGILK